MAGNTDIQLRNQVIYSVYLRAHTPEGTFTSMIPDLDRIRALGTDIIWFMPIHPIGIAGKKGSLGCPYANRDYRTTNPAYGTMEEFQALVEEIHSRGMKCMIDVVYNHTSPDATLVTEHPEFYYRNPDGSFGNRNADWTDIIDLDYSVSALWDYQIASLKQWAKIVDGFRCDVASLVPAAFWVRARKEVAQVNPDCIWLAESVHAAHNIHARMNGQAAATDAELYEAFDMEYVYDIREVFDHYLAGTAPLEHYLDMVNLQEAVYPNNYIKLRCLENHDMPRIASFIKDARALRSFTGFLYFLKGATLLYGGQEFANDHLPSLFEKDVFSRETGTDLSPLLRRLGEIKKQHLSAEDYFFGRAYGDVAVLERNDGRTRKLGIFSLKGQPATVPVELPDGNYRNLVDGETVAVAQGQLYTTGEPVIL